MLVAGEEELGEDQKVDKPTVTLTRKIVFTYICPGCGEEVEVRSAYVSDVKCPECHSEYKVGEWNG